MKIETDDYILTYDDSAEAKERIFEIMLKAFQKLKHYSGESLQQSDSTYEMAPDILSKVAEKGFKFKIKYKDDE